VPPALVFRAVGVLERTDGETDGADDLGLEGVVTVALLLAMLSLLIIDGVLDPVAVR
jgi:hypothetical protein